MSQSNQTPWKENRRSSVSGRAINTEILEFIHLGISVQEGNAEGRFLFWNAAMETLFGKQRDDVLGQPVSSVFGHSDDYESWVRFDSLVLKTGKAMDVPFLKIHSAENETILRVRKIPVAEKGTGNTIILSVAEDITRSKRSEQELVRAHKEREHLEEIVNLSPVVLILFRNESGFPVEFNSGNIWRFNLPTSFDSASNVGLLEFIGAVNESLFQTKLESISLEQPEVQFEFRVKDAWYEVTLRPVDRMIRGQPLIQGVFVEVTERHQMLEELARSKQLAEAANLAKTRFLATVTHELRTPLNGILGMSSLVLDTELDDQQREFMDLVKYSAENLLQIINDILDFSKLEAGQLLFEWIPVELQALIGRSLKALESLANRNGIELLLDLHSDLERSYLLDPVRVTQILHNVVGNGIKFTKEGFVKVTAMPVGKAPSEIQRVIQEKTDLEANSVDPLSNLLKEWIYLCVQDTGIGIPEEKQDLVFQEFAQSDASTSRKFGGTGLGLTICRTLISRFGGEIWLDSVEGEGSRFHFFLRLKPVSQTDEGASSSLREAPEDSMLLRFRNTPLNVLLAEDNPVNARVAMKHIKKMGWKVTHVENGKQALDELEQHEFDVVLMDIYMPVMDGVEALKAIRNHETLGIGSRIPVIAMTASSLNEQEALLQFDGFVPKPFEPNDLKRVVLQSVLENRKD